MKISYDSERSDDDLAINIAIRRDCHGWSPRFCIHVKKHIIEVDETEAREIVRLLTGKLDEFDSDGLERHVAEQLRRR